ncbi:MAG: hypothetical protein JWQ96_184 [Segetibacter sp.]|nr:hypothetical protein [Segetibacter sp.]
MSTITRKIVLDALIKHETLTINDLSKKENLGIAPNIDHLGFLIEELIESGHVDMLDGITPCTYTITDKGIKEGARVAEEANF